MKLRAIGYWASAREMQSGLPDPRDFIDPAWDMEERFVVAEIALTNPQLIASVCDDLQSLRVPFERHEGATAAPEELLG